MEDSIFLSLNILVLVAQKKKKLEILGKGEYCIGLAECNVILWPRETVTRGRCVAFCQSVHLKISFMLYVIWPANYLFQIHGGTCS